MLLRSERTLKSRFERVKLPSASAHRGDLHAGRRAAGAELLLEPGDAPEGAWRHARASEQAAVGGARVLLGRHRAERADREPGLPGSLVPDSRDDAAP